MCDAENQAREWIFYIQDMLGFGENVLSFTNGLDKDAFVADMRTYAATLRYIELIGEAATHVPASVRQLHPDIPWRAMIGARNRLAHSYLYISDSAVCWIPPKRIRLDLPLDSTSDANRKAARCFHPLHNASMT